MKYFLAAVLLITALSCAQISQQLDRFKTSENNNQSNLSEKYERRVEYKIDVNSTASNSYKKANLWLAKKLNNSKYAIQLQDEKEFNIVAKVATTCRTINDFIEMDLDFKAKDKKIKVVFENIMFKQSTGMFAGLMDPYPNSASQLSEFKRDCLDVLVNDLQKLIETNNDW